MDIETMHGSSDENGSADSDTTDLEEINSLFAPCRHLHSQTLGPNYILHIAATSETDPYIAAALSDYSCEIFGLTGNQVAKITKFKEHTGKLIGCKFSLENNNSIYTASSDGTVKLWDLRDCKKSVFTFSDTTSNGNDLMKCLSSFDVSPCNRLLVAGTDLIEGDAYILFWDIRNTKLLGAYWESHTDDITQVKFHPEDSNKLLSGSTDGLINIYNVSESTEEDAFQECLNTEALVEELQWFNENDQWKISCTTSANDLQLWIPDGAEPYKRFSRSDIALQIKKPSDNTYVAKTHPIKELLLVLAGSNGHQSKYLRSLQISNGVSYPAVQFSENTQRVRSSWVNENTALLLTGGEKGILDIWNFDSTLGNFKSSRRK